MKTRKLELPEKISATLKLLEKRAGYNITVVKISGKYYVYHLTSKKSGNKREVTNLYFGKIDADGRFFPSQKARLDGLDASFGRSGSGKTDDPQDKLMCPDSTDKKILEIISSDGRASISDIAANIGFTKSITERRLHKLEHDYKISYTLEFGPRPFSFFRYVVLVRFIGEPPGNEEMKRIFDEEPRVQLAVLLKGKYDLMLYMLAEDTQKLEDTIYRMRSSKELYRHKMLWHVSYITYAYGYTPIRDKFIEFLKTRIWKRSRETPRRLPGQITEREYNVLRELNMDGRITFSEIDRKVGLENNASSYTYYKLLENLTIERVTISMQALPMMYSAIIIVPQTDMQRFNNNRNAVFKNFIENPDTPSSRYAIEGDFGSPYGLFFIRPIYNESLNSVEEEMKNVLKADNIRSYVITEIMVGSIGYRRLPYEDTYQFKELQETGNAPKPGIKL